MSSCTTGILNAQNVRFPHWFWPSLQTVYAETQTDPDMAAIEDMCVYNFTQIILHVGPIIFVSYQSILFTHTHSRVCVCLLPGHNLSPYFQPSRTWKHRPIMNRVHILFLIWFISLSPNPCRNRFPPLKPVRVLCAAWWHGEIQSIPWSQTRAKARWLADRSIWAQANERNSRNEQPSDWQLTSSLRDSLTQPIVQSTSEQKQPWYIATQH